MDKNKKCSIIIYDDFNNVLIAQKGKVKKNSVKIWSILGKELKGKETNEKCITKVVDKDLKCNIFDLAPFKEYDFEEENMENLAVYTGKIREQISCHTDIKQIKWISEREMNMYDFPAGERKILLDFFESRK